MDKYFINVRYAFKLKYFPIKKTQKKDRNSFFTKCGLKLLTFIAKRINHLLLEETLTFIFIFLITGTINAISKITTKIASAI